MMDRLISLSVGTEGAEDYFSTFQDVSELARNMGAVHNYVNVTASAVDAPVDDAPEELYHDENTINKVRQALWAALASKTEDIPASILDDMINSMQNVGILFRERRS